MVLYVSVGHEELINLAIAGNVFIGNAVPFFPKRCRLADTGDRAFVAFGAGQGDRTVLIRLLFDFVLDPSLGVAVFLVADLALLNRVDVAGIAHAINLLRLRLVVFQHGDLLVDYDRGSGLVSDVFGVGDDPMHGIEAAFDHPVDLGADGKDAIRVVPIVDPSLEFDFVVAL